MAGTRNRAREGRPSRRGTSACPQPGPGAVSCGTPGRRAPAVARTPLHKTIRNGTRNSPHRLTKIFLRWSRNASDHDHAQGPFQALGDGDGRQPGAGSAPGDRAAGARQNADEKLQPRHAGPVSSLPKTPGQEADCLSHSLVHRTSSRAAKQCRLSYDCQALRTEPGVPRNAALPDQGLVPLMPRPPGLVPAEAPAAADTKARKRGDV